MANLKLVSKGKFVLLYKVDTTEISIITECVKNMNLEMIVKLARLKR